MFIFFSRVNIQDCCMGERVKGRGGQKIFSLLNLRRVTYICIVLVNIRNTYTCNIIVENSTHLVIKMNINSFDIPKT